MIFKNSPTFWFSLLIIINRCVFPKCVFKLSKNNQMFVFNLNRLEKIPYKEIHFNHMNNMYIMYFSLCQRIQDFPVSLSANGGDNLRIVLIMKSANSNFTCHYFELENEPAVTDNSLQFVGSSKTYLSVNQKIFCSIEINIRISDKEREPAFESYDTNNCRFVFVWDTALVTFNDKSPSVSCVAKSNSDLLNLSPLQSETYYLAKENEITIYFNFCGPIQAEECEVQEGSLFSACILHNGGKQILTGKSLSRTVYKKDKSTWIFEFLNLNNQNGSFSTVVVTMPCNMDSFTVKPSLHTSKKGHRLSIQIPSYVPCDSKESCDFYHNNYKYKLPLETNVQVQHNGSVFLLSPCGRLRDDSIWMEGRARAALINGSSFMSLGFTRSLEFHNGENNSVQVIFTGGSKCENSELRAKTVISFYCSSKTTTSGPVFNIHQSNNCKFFFDWEDPSFCPVPGSLGENCVARDSILGFSFDFNLYNSSQDLTISNNGSTFKINLCGEIKNSCNSSLDVSICMLRNKQEIVLGKRSSQLLMYEYGAVIFKLIGEECRPGVFYHNYINCICDYGASTNSVPVFVNEDSNCTYNFTWNSKICCPPEKSVPCRVTNKNGKLIDLSPLRKLTSNYKIQKDENSYFLLNVCGSLWYGHEEICVAGSGACLFEKKNFKSIGMIREKPYVNNFDEIELKYENNLPCASTIITFVCDEENKDPVYKGLHNCTYTFIWKTIYACGYSDEKFPSTTIKVPISTSGIKIAKKTNITTKNYVISQDITTSPPQFSNTTPPRILVDDNSTRNEEKQIVDQLESKKFSCVIPDSENQFDLSVLGQRNIKVNNNITMFINIYNFVNVSYSNCSTAFSCLVDSTNKTISLGSNYSLSRDSNILKLKHYKGSHCKDNKYYSLSIIFRCNETSGLGYPKIKFPFLENCTYNILWDTAVACPEKKLIFDKINGYIYDNNAKQINLEKIINNTQKENLKIDFSSAHNFKMPCNGNVCIEKKGKWVSGGVIEDNVFNSYNKSVLWLRNGDICTENRRYSTKISLYCLESKEGSYTTEPWTVSEKDCEFSLELKSSLACFSPVVHKKSINNWKSNLIITSICFAVLTLIIGIFFLLHKFKQVIHNYLPWKTKRRKSVISDEICLFSRYKKLH